MSDLRRSEARVGDRIAVKILQSYETYGGDITVERGQREGTIIDVGPSAYRAQMDSGRVESFGLHSESIVRAWRPA